MIGNRQLLALYACFFASGVAGLIYEVIWEKYLALFMGGTGLAQIVVLSTFMGGLALGNWLFGRLADRVPSALRLYVALEVGIGVYALLFDPIYNLGRQLFIQVVSATNLTAGGLVAGKVLSCAACILAPTVLMGGTLPAMSRHIVRSSSAIGPRVSRLYFLNSLGAVAGCLLTGFYLVRAFGLQFSMIVGAALNLLAAAAAMGASARGRSAAAPAPADAGAPAGDAAPRRNLAALLLLCAGLSGAAAMVYEVAWIRLLSLVLGTSTYSFSLMLATFILGLSIGALLLSLRKKETGYILTFGLSEVFVAVAVLLTLPLYVRLPYLFNQIASSLNREPATFPLYEGSKFLLCAAVMLAPTVLQGITLPAAAKALAVDVGTLGRRVGSTFAVNTLGTLVGAVLAGFVGLPLLGIRGSIEAAIALNLLVGFALIAADRGSRGRGAAAAAAGLSAAGACAAYALLAGNWDQDLLGTGAFRQRQRIASYSEFVEGVRQRQTLFHRDGIDATVAVQDIAGGSPDRFLVINGKTDASAVADMPTQAMMGHLPLLCRPDARRVLVVGLGTGATAGAVLAHDVAQVDIVEISRDVVAASRFFGPSNGRYWEDPRARVIWEDAKTYLQVADREYDLIVSEPTNPWIAGVAGVFSAEFFEQCRRRLAPGGLFVQWIQGYEMEDAVFYLILETFSAAFPHYTLWNPTRADTVLIGSTVPYRPDLERMRIAAGRPSVRDDLRKIGIESLLPVLAMQMTDRAATDSHVPWLGARHSDFFPVLEYVAPRGFFVGSKAEGIRWMDERRESPANAKLWVREYIDRFHPSGEEFFDCYRYMKAHPGLFDRMPLACATAWAEAYPSDGEARQALAAETPPTHDRALERSAAAAGDSYGIRRWRALMAHADFLAEKTCFSPAGAEKALEALTALANTPGSAGDAVVRRRLGEVAYDLGRYGAAADSLREATEMLLARGVRNDELVETGVALCHALLADGRPADAGAAWDRCLLPVRSDLRARLVKSKLLAAMRSNAGRE